MHGGDAAASSKASPSAASKTGMMSRVGGRGRSVDVKPPLKGIDAADGASAASDSESTCGSSVEEAWDASLREVGIAVRDLFAEGEADSPAAARGGLEVSFSKGDATAYLALVPVDDDLVVGAQIMAHVPGNGGIRSCLERQGKVLPGMHLTLMNGHDVSSMEFADILTLLKWGLQPGVPLLLRFELLPPPPPLPPQQPRATGAGRHAAATPRKQSKAMRILKHKRGLTAPPMAMAGLAELAAGSANAATEAAATSPPNTTEEQAHEEEVVERPVTPSPLRARLEQLRHSVLDTIARRPPAPPPTSPPLPPQPASQLPASSSAASLADAADAAGAAGLEGTITPGRGLRGSSHVRNKSEPARKPPSRRQSLGSASAQAPGPGGNPEVESLLMAMRVPCDDVPLWQLEGMSWADVASSVVMQRRGCYYALALTRIALYVLELEMREGPPPPGEKGPLPPASSIGRLRCVARLEPGDVDRIILPYTTQELDDGTEVAQRTADVVVVCAPADPPPPGDVTASPSLHQRTFSAADLCPRGPQPRFVWLRLASNEVRGVMLEYMDQWYARWMGDDSGDLPADQEPESSLLAEIAAGAMSSILDAALEHGKPLPDAAGGNVDAVEQFGAVSNQTPVKGDRALREQP